MFDKNYLGHNLILFRGNQNQIGVIYTCTLCNNNFLYTRDFGSLNSKDRVYKIYTTSRGFIECKNSCEDLIIKNILE